MPGSPTPDDNIRRRVSRMEKMITTLMDQLDDSLRIAVPTDFRDIALARTAIKPGGTYPSSGQTFWIEFLDGYFTDNSGDQPATWETLGLADGVHAHNIDDEHVTQGTIVLAVWQDAANSESDGEWWFQKMGTSAAGLFLCNFTLNAELVLGGTAQATVGTCSDSVATIFSSTITVKDEIGKFKGYQGYKGMAWKYRADEGCAWQIVEMEEQAEMIQAILTDANPFSGAIGDVSNASVDDFWQGHDPGETVVVEDRAGIYGDLKTNTRVICSWDELDEVYVVIDAKQAPAGDEDCVETTGRGTLAEPQWDKMQDGVEVWPVDKIRVNRDTVLRAWYDDFEEIFLIGIDVAERKNSILWSDETSVRWNDGPFIGHCLTVGGDQDGEAGNSYIRIKGNAQATELGIWTFAVTTESDGNEQAWIMPSNRPTDHNTHIVVEKTGNAATPSAPECLLLKWTSQGKDGSFEFPTSIDIDFAGETWSWDASCLITVEAGIITGIQSKTAPGDTITVGCSDTTVNPTHDADCDFQNADEQNPCNETEKLVTANQGVQVVVTMFSTADLDKSSSDNAGLSDFVTIESP